QRVGLMLVATLLALGILEHWFLVLPFSEEVIWRWALRGNESVRSLRVVKVMESGEAKPEVGVGPGPGL
ncbi:MAG TPA: DUF3623 family protein, partial [Chromatiaceae bacterium]|nr:DUF3623 family protein [Chromatiaceae bacterium]